MKDYIKLPKKYGAKDSENKAESGKMDEKDMKAMKGKKCPTCGHVM